MALDVFSAGLYTARMAPLIPVSLLALALPLQAAASPNPSYTLKFEPKIEQIAGYAASPLDALDKAGKVPTYLLSICFSKNILKPVDGTETRCPYRNYAANSKLGKAALDMAEAREYIDALRQLTQNAEHLQKAATAGAARDFNDRTDAALASANSANNKLVVQNKAIERPLAERYKVLTIRYIDAKAQTEADTGRAIALRLGRDIIVLPTPADLYAGSAP